ncbi:hypothetical protein BOTBODRAFT_38502 [Botryobasidium botryosum FD-172 SS1]|uniref:F-box domain-containing protein n=1 Tax=Botryobasidium botryosum (strain FD-172 SS1) TaxID=930990 RepID=A0A067LZM6_BOTB1|nr:hypothetical protein BOTBODRAFT_38502 [Botryobasidium botryosum FD-172 SS1]
MESLDFPRLLQSIIEDIRSRPLTPSCGADAFANATSQSHSQGPLEEARAAVHDSIRIIERAVADAVSVIRAHEKLDIIHLRRRRNHLAPIHRLPCEILSAIFGFAADACTERDYPKSYFPLTVLGVSYLWRQIALQSPRLWARPHTLLPRPLFETYIRRSKNASLDIFFAPKDRGQKRLDLAVYMGLVSSHAARWRSCTLNCVSPKRMAPHFQLPAPKLEALSLNYGDMDTARDTDLSTVLLNPFSGYAPRLRELSLGGVFVPFTSPIYANLSTLRLARIRYTKPDAFQQLMQLLDRTPLLEVLCLDYLNFPSATNTSHSEEPLINLPLLRLLRMKTMQIDQQWVLRHILSRVATPPSCHLELSAMLDANDSLGSIIPQQSNAHHLQNIANVGSLEITCYPEMTIFEARGAKADVGGFSITTEDYAGHAQVLGALSCIGKAFPMPCLESLTLSWSDYEPTEVDPAVVTAFADLLVRHPSIKELQLRHCPELLIKSLVGTSSAPVCPNLHTLAVSDCRSLRDGTLESVVASRRLGHIVPLSDISVRRCPNVSASTILTSI